MDDLALGYQEICQGWSQGKLKGETVLFRHATPFDNFKITKAREESLRWAKSHNFPSREEALARAYKEGSWTEEQERELTSNQENLKTFWATRNKPKTIPSNDKSLFNAVRSFHQNIDDYREMIDSSLALKFSALGENQETYASSKAFDMEVCTLSQKLDESPLVSLDEFYDNDFPTEILKSQYYLNVSRLDHQFLQKLSVSDFFFSVFDHYIENSSDFFRKRGYELTNNQVSLLTEGKRFNNVVKNAGNAPADFYDDPIKLETLAIFRSNGNSQKEDSIIDMAADAQRHKIN